MKSAKIFALLFILALVSVRIFVYSTIQSNPSEQIRITYLRNLELANESVNELTQNSQAYSQSKISLTTLKESYLKTRKYFKKVEFLLEYFSHQQVKELLNGPLEKNQLLTPRTLMDQQGLQVLDQMIYGKTARTNPEDILKASKSFAAHFNAISQQHKSINLTNISIFEASRDELIRLFTLGLSGFDTPNSENAFADAITVMETLQASVNVYLNNSDAQHQETEIKVTESFNKAITTLRQAANPGLFDRIHFLRTALNPLYKSLYQLQIKLGYESSLESTDAIILNDIPYDQQAL